MRRKLVLLLFLVASCFTGIAHAEDRPLRVRLFDFETGVTGWLGNPWGGGKCGAEPSLDAKFGDGALRGWYADVEKGANVICPYLPEDAAWRKSPWGGISF
ncbi:MAG: hypothetical protein HY318_16375, partial [Armatimonadetes bacterium]|nr:hypothetical protein [Armatimonadota bacterium]